MSEPRQGASNTTNRIGRCVRGPESYNSSTERGYTCTTQMSNLRGSKLLLGQGFDLMSSSCVNGLTILRNYSRKE